MPAIRRTLLFTDRSFQLHLRDCHSLWCCFPTDFGSLKGYSPPHLPPCYQDGIRFDLTGFHSLLLTGSQLVSLPPSTKMLHFEGLLHITVLSQIHGSKTACVYPWRFAACRVTLRTQAKPSTIWRVATYDKCSTCEPLRIHVVNTLLSSRDYYLLYCSIPKNRTTPLPSLHTPFFTIQTIPRTANRSRAVENANVLNKVCIMNARTVDMSK